MNPSELRVTIRGRPLHLSCTDPHADLTLTSSWGFGNRRYRCPIASLEHPLDNPRLPLGVCAN